MELEKVFFIVKSRGLRVKGSWVLEKPIKKTYKKHQKHLFSVLGRVIGKRLIFACMTMNHFRNVFIVKSIFEALFVIATSKIRLVSSLNMDKCKNCHLIGWSDGSYNYVALIQG